MQPLPGPFGPASRGLDVVWPQWTGPSIEPRRTRRPAEIWEIRPESEDSPGGTVLADLTEATHSSDALLVLARYLVVRCTLHSHGRNPPPCNPQIEHAAAREYLDALPADVAERRWLAAILAMDGGKPGRTLVSRLNAAAAAAGRTGHVHGAFALRRTAWEIATANGWHAEAGRVARAVAAAAERGGGRRSKRLWSRRARVHEARSRR